MDDEERIAREAGRLEREAQAIPERWLALVAGRSTADAPPIDGEDAAHAHLFEPLDDAFEEAVTDRLHAAVTSPAAAPRSRRRRGRAFGLFTGIAALAAGALFFVLPGAEPAPLPAFRLDDLGAATDVRGSAAPSAEVAVYDADTPLSVVLRPAEPVTGPVAVRAFVERGPRLERIDLRAEVAETGAIRIEAALDALVSSGASTAVLWFAVGRPDQLPDSTSARRRDGGDGWQSFRYALRLRPKVP